MPKICYFVGTDEAGYGPNLGPLLISATSWKMILDSAFPHPRKVPPKHSVPPLFADLDDDFEPPSFDSTNSIIAELNRRLADFCGLRGFFPIVDSKKLYHSGHLAPLERSFFLAFLSLFRNETSEITFKKIVKVLGDGEETSSESIPFWEKGGDFSLPMAISKEKWRDFRLEVDRVRDEFREVGVTITAMKSRRVQPEKFNRLLEIYGLKSDLLAAATLELASGLTAPILQSGVKSKDETALILLCDKLGGRNRYGDLLVRFFPEIPFQTRVESRPLSVYRASLAEGRMTFEVRFQAKGEANLPTAMASIASKFLREMSMAAFNAFWEKKIPGIRPTAGYPLDAKRFRKETQEIRSEMRLDDSTFWRNK